MFLGLNPVAVDLLLYSCAPEEVSAGIPSEAAPGGHHDFSPYITYAELCLGIHHRGM